MAKGKATSCVSSKGQHHAAAGKTQFTAIDSGHGDDGVYSVDIAEISQNEQQHFFILAYLPEGLGQPPEGMVQLPLAVFQVMGLPHVPQQRNGKSQPPYSCKEEGELGGLLGVQAKGGGENQRQSSHKGDTAAQVAPGVSLGGEHIHPLVCGDVYQHGIIKDIAGGIPDTHHHKGHQKGLQPETMDSTATPPRERTRNNPNSRFFIPR